MSDPTPPDFIEREPEVIVYSLLNGEWNSDNISGRFELDSQGRPKWLHTGWYDQDPNPQISVTPRNEGPSTPSSTGYTGIDAAGNGPTAMIDGQVDVNVWVPTDSNPYPKTGVNPKKLAGELKREVKRIIGTNALGTTYNGQPELQHLGIGRITSPPEPDEADLASRYLIPVTFSYYQGREPSDG